MSFTRNVIGLSDSFIGLVAMSLYWGSQLYICLMCRSCLLVEYRGK